MSENNSGSMMGGFLLGAVVGAGLALIFAPMAGEETRRRIGDTARNLKDAAREQLGSVKDVVKEGAGDVGAALDAGKDAFQRKLETASSSRESS